MTTQHEPSPVEPRDISDFLEQASFEHGKQHRADWPMHEVRGRKSPVDMDAYFYGDTDEQAIDAAIKHVGDLDKWDIENGLIGIVRQLMNSDEDDSTSQCGHILEAYKNADARGRIAINRIMTSLCGYSLATILRAMVKRGAVTPS